MPVSISVVMATAIAVSAALAAIVAFVPTYTRGIDTTQETVASLRANIIGRVDNGVANFFKGPAKAAETIDLLAKSGVDLTSGSDLDIVSRVMDQIFVHEGATQASLLSPTNSWLTGIDLAPHPVGSYFNGTHLVSRFYDPAARDWLYAMNPATKEMEPVPWMTGYFEYDPNFLFQQYSNPAYHRPGRYWSHARHGFDAAQYEALAMFTAPVTNKPLVFLVSFLTKAVSDHLASLNLPRRARALAIDANNEIVVANSWGAEMRELRDYLNFSASEEERVKLFKLSDMNDTLVTSAVEHIGGTQAFFDIKTNYSDVMGNGKERVFVDVFRVSDRAGPEMVILLIMPEIDFLEDTYKSRDETIGAVCGALGALILLAVVFSILIVQPLHRLGDRMYKTASLQDEDADDTPSLLSEVRSMQTAYTTMKQELNRMKSYLPQSVLCTLSNDDDEEEEEEEEQKSVVSGKSGASGASSGAEELVAVRSPSFDTRSRSSRSSVVPERKSNTPHHLNTGKSVTSKRVVVVAFNLCGFHGRLGSSNQAAKDLSQLQTRFLTLINQSVRENKGVVDLFQGDHVLASFNAVSNVVSAPKRAALAAMHVCQEASKIPELPPVSVGLSAGTAFVGNMGSHDMQRFNIVGPVYVEAMMMERLARNQIVASAASAAPHLWRILSLGNIIQDISLEFYYQCVDLVALPSNPLKPQVAVSLEQLKTVSSGEWMYMLEEGANADPFTEINEAYFALLRGGLEDAKMKLGTAKCRPDNKTASGKERLENILHTLTTSKSAAAGDDATGSDAMGALLRSVMTYVSFATPTIFKREQ